MSGLRCARIGRAQPALVEDTALHAASYASSNEDRRRIRASVYFHLNDARATHLASLLADEIRIRANREGIYVRTLIPAGTWDLTCTVEGYRPANILGVKLEPGEHRIEHFTLEALEEKPEPEPEDGP